MGIGEHKVPLIKTSDGRIRKLTPRECFNLQGFPNVFILPEKVSNTLLYKQAGNFVVVSVIKAIAKKYIMLFQIFNYLVLIEERNIKNA